MLPNQGNQMTRPFMSYILMLANPYGIEIGIINVTSWKWSSIKSIMEEDYLYGAAALFIGMYISVFGSE